MSKEQIEVAARIICTVMFFFAVIGISTVLKLILDYMQILWSKNDQRFRGYKCQFRSDRHINRIHYPNATWRKPDPLFATLAPITKPDAAMAYQTLIIKPRFGKGVYMSAKHYQGLTTICSFILSATKPQNNSTLSQQFLNFIPFLSSLLAYYYGISNSPIPTIRVWLHVRSNNCSNRS